MKIEKLENGNIIIKNNNDKIEHIIATGVFLQLHPRNETGVLISRTPSNQDTEESITVFAESVSAINEESFTGNRNDLLLLLSELFNTGGAGSESGAYIPVYQITSFDSFVRVNNTSEIEVKGVFLDYINSVTITALSDNSGVSVSIKSKSFNLLVLEVIANNVSQEFDLELCSFSNQRETLLLKTETIKIPTINDWENVSSGLSVFEGGVQTTNNIDSWNKQATFGTIPVNSNGELVFTFDGPGINGTGSSLGMVGLGNDPTANASYDTIDYAIYVNSGNLYIYENEDLKIGLDDAVSEGDIFRIVRQSGQVRYFKDNEEFYTSIIQSTGELYFDCSLYRNIKISNIKLIY